MIAGLYESQRPINITGVDKVHLKCDCIHSRKHSKRSSRTNLYSLLLINHLVIKKTKNQESNFFKKKSVLSHITFCLEDDYKLVDFNIEIVSFTCQLIKKIGDGHIQTFLYLYTDILTNILVLSELKYDST